jgi:BioD-like phosphotransacetylase family protein
LKSVYISSSLSGSGKTSIAVTLAKYLIGKSKKVAFFKPVVKSKSDGSSNRLDGLIMKQFLGLEEIPEVISPEFPDETSLSSNIVAAFTKISATRDVVIIESESTNFKTNEEIIRNLGPSVLGVEIFQDNLAEVLVHYKEMGKYLTGVIINKVPHSRFQALKETNHKLGIKVMGVIPESRLLTGPTVQELANGVNGKIINNMQSQGVVTNFIIGAMNPDHGSSYYARKMDKAVIISSNRPDMQLSALENSMKCLVVAGPKAPIPMVLNRAESKKVPIISVNNSVSAIITDIENILNKRSLHREAIELTTSIFEKDLDSGNLCRELGLSD